MMTIRGWVKSGQEALQGRSYKRRREREQGCLGPSLGLVERLDECPRHI